MNIRLACAVLAATLATGAHAASPLPPVPPPARVDPVTDDYFGTKVTDPYRWMESEPKPEFRTMLERQNTYARAVLAGIPGRDKLRDDIAATSGLATRLLTMTPVLGRRFYLKRPPGGQVARLYVADAAGRETLLVDPERLGTQDRHMEIDQFAPSQDGNLVAYGLSSGGSEVSTLHVLRTQTRAALPDEIDRAEFADVSWLPDGGGFFYTRLAKLPAGAPATEHYAHMRVYLHRLGSDPATDQVIVEADHLPVAFHAAQIFPFIEIVPGSAHAILGIANGVSPEVAFCTAPLADVAAGHARWREIASQADGVTWMTVRGDSAYLLSHHAAPRFQILGEDLRAPDFSSASTVLAQDSGVFTGMAASAEALYVAERRGGSMVLLRLPAGADHAAEISLPYAGSISPPLEDAGGLSADPRVPGAVFSLESWLRPVTWLGYDPAVGRVRDLGAIPAYPRDTSGYDTIETEVRAPDNIEVPLTIVAKHGIKLDGSHPTLVNGYGSYGISADAGFIPFAQPWLDRGGVLAIAHVRGGGELGQPWHDGGKIATKQNTITDFIACAEEMVRRGYTTPARLDGSGTSAGGILIGGAITRRPDLFRAALIRVGSTNALREEYMESGPANIPEFGTVKNPAQFPAMLKMDAFNHVKDGTPYPAVLLTGGFNDPRVTVWIPAKMTARLQAASTSGRPILFRVEFDAGHGIGSTRNQVVEEFADSLAFLLWQDGVAGYQPAP